MGRIQGLTESGVLTGDTLIKGSAAGEIHSLTFAWNGETAGERLVFYDGNDATGTPLVVFTIPTADGTLTKEWPQGKRFETGLYMSMTGLANAEVELTYK